MTTFEESMKQALLRFIIVSGLIIACAFAAYQFHIFNPQMKVSQFFSTGITIGIAYAGFKGFAYRNVLATEFVWCVILIGLAHELILWIVVLGVVYVGMMTLAIYIYLFVMPKQFVKGLVWRVLTVTILIGITNGVIVLILGILSFGAVFAHPIEYLGECYYNLRIGIVIGLLAAIGMEIAEVVVKKYFVKPAEAAGESTLS